MQVDTVHEAYFCDGLKLVVLAEKSAFPVSNWLGFLNSIPTRRKMQGENKKNKNKKLDFYYLQYKIVLHAYVRTYVRKYFGIPVG